MYLLQSLLGTLPDSYSPFCAGPKRSTFVRPLSKESNNTTVVPSSECNEDNCIKGRPLAAPYDNSRYGSCPLVALA